MTAEILKKYLELLRLTEEVDHYDGLVNVSKYASLEQVVRTLATLNIRELKVIKNYVDELIEYKEMVKNVVFYCPKCNYEVKAEEVLDPPEFCIICGSKMLMKRFKEG